MIAHFVRNTIHIYKGYIEKIIHQSINNNYFCNFPLAYVISNHSIMLYIFCINKTYGRGYLQPNPSPPLSPTLGTELNSPSLLFLREMNHLDKVCITSTYGEPA
jgi:hypothetical protein